MLQVFQVSLVSLVTQVKCAVCHLEHNKAVMTAILQQCLKLFYFSNLVRVLKFTSSTSIFFMFLNELPCTNWYTGTCHWNILSNYNFGNCLLALPWQDFIPGDLTGSRCPVAHMHYIDIWNTWAISLGKPRSLHVEHLEHFTWNIWNYWNSCDNCIKVTSWLSHSK